MPSESRKQTATRETCKNVGGSAYSWAVCFFVVDVYSCFVCAIVSARIASGFVFWFFILFSVNVGCIDVRVLCSYSSELENNSNRLYSTR